MANTIKLTSSKEAALSAEKSQAYNSGKLLAQIRGQLIELPNSAKFVLAIKTGLYYDFNFLGATPRTNQFLYQTICNQLFTFGASPNNYNYEPWFRRGSICTCCKQFIHGSGEFYSSNNVSAGCNQCLALLGFSNGWKCFPATDKNTFVGQYYSTNCRNYNYWDTLFRRVPIECRAEFEEIFRDIVDKRERW
jgi:hypothetical protein